MNKIQVNSQQVFERRVLKKCLVLGWTLTPKSGESGTMRKIKNFFGTIA